MALCSQAVDASIFRSEMVLGRHFCDDGNVTTERVLHNINLRSALPHNMAINLSLCEPGSWGTPQSLGQGWRTFLRANAQIVYKFRRNPFVCQWKF